jgi:hypothetical protein
MFHVKVLQSSQPISIQNAVQPSTIVPGVTGRAGSQETVSFLMRLREKLPLLNFSVIRFRTECSGPFCDILPVCTCDTATILEISSGFCMGYLAMISVDIFYSGEW